MNVSKVAALLFLNCGALLYCLQQSDSAWLDFFPHDGVCIDFLKVTFYWFIVTEFIMIVRCYRDLISGTEEQDINFGIKCALQCLAKIWFQYHLLILLVSCRMGKQGSN